jgi:phosphatidylinositol-3-phosphatase
MRWMLGGLALVALAATPAAEAAKKPPPTRHVFIITLENKSFDATFGPTAGAPYLAGPLARKGALLTRYFGTGHFSLGNYITLISGQSENPSTQSDCTTYSDFTFTGTAPGGQALGFGCVYPPQIKTIADQLEAAGLRWKGYMQDMGNDPARESATCGHPAIGARDDTQGATATDQYATRHDPFMYFHSVIDDQASCNAHVVALTRLRHDLRKAKRTPNYAFITPDLCADGHDETCADPSQPGGYEGIDAFLRTWAPRILKSPAMKKNGLLIVTFDEAESGADACCFAPTGPNTLLQGIYGPGGGRTGAVLISNRIRPGTVSDHPYNHYSLLRTVEDIFGLDPLGYAANPAVTPFGPDVYTRAPAA